MGSQASPVEPTVGHRAQRRLEMEGGVTAGISPACGPQGTGESGLPRGTPTVGHRAWRRLEMEGGVTAGINPA